MLTPFQAFVTIALVTVGTMLTRFLPFLLFPDAKKAPSVVRYLGSVLPCAVMGMLVVYCLKGVDLLGPTHGLPEILAVAAVAALHCWKRNSLLSIGVGTIFYMFLVQVIF